MEKLDGKVAIITGASSGIGKQTAIRFAEEGAKVVICARRETMLKETAGLCEAAGSEALPVVCNLRNYEEMVLLVKAAVDRFKKIDILVNNAIAGSIPHPFIESTIEEFTTVFETGFLSQWHMMQLCYPYLKASGKGSVINVSSAAGPMGMAGHASYASTKEAGRGLTRVVAREWGVDNIRVNDICPAAVTDTIKTLKGTSVYDKLTSEFIEYSKFKRLGDAYDDVTPAMVFLASDDSHWITGQTLHADGGAWITA